MTVFTLTFAPSTDQIIAGIPTTLEIVANQASTIYYTLDGSLPTLLSSVYVGPIELPTDTGVVVASALAYYVDDMMALVPSAILTDTYRTDQTDLDRTRYVFFEGVVYSYPGGLNIPIYYDYAGLPSFTEDITEEELLFLAPENDIIGNIIPPDNQIGLIPPNETATLIDNDFPLFATPNGADTFNPEAKLIVVDGRATAPEQVVRLINGPNMSLRSAKTSFGGIDYFNTYGTNYVSGGATRYYFNRDKKIIVFYYVDTNTNRWVKSIQDLPDAPIEVATPIRSPLVFKWINFGRQQMPI